MRRGEGNALALFGRDALLEQVEMGLEHDSRLHDMEIVAALKHRFPDWAMRLTSCAGKRAAPGLDKEVPTLPCTVRLGRGRTQADVIIRTDSQRNVRGQQWLARSQVPVELLIRAQWLRIPPGTESRASQEVRSRCNSPFPERDRRTL